MVAPNPTQEPKIGFTVRHFAGQAPGIGFGIPRSLLYQRKPFAHCHELAETLQVASVVSLMETIADRAFLYRVTIAPRAGLLLGASDGHPHWFETGKGMIAIDTLVHN